MEVGGASVNHLAQLKNKKLMFLIFRIYRILMFRIYRIFILRIYHIRDLPCIRWYFPLSVTKTMATAVDGSRLDYCNSLLYNIVRGMAQNSNVCKLNYPFSSVVYIHCSFL